MILTELIQQKRYAYQILMFEQPTKRMKKSDKLLEASIVRALTEVCEALKRDFSGFCWLTHTVNYRDFPASLRVIIVFDSNASRATFMHAEQKKRFLSNMQDALTPLGIAHEEITQHISYDSEQACMSQHQGDWNRRLRTH